MVRKQLLFQHVNDILQKNYSATSDRFLLLVYDQRCTLAALLTEAYQEAIKHHPHESIDFDTIAEDDLITRFNSLPPHSVVILVQSYSFRTTKYRLRADLFRLGHQVVEHARVAHNTDDQIDTYIDSLRYDTDYYVRVTNALEQLLIGNNTLRVESHNGLVLVVNSPFEKPIKNTGDFTGNPTASTGFPIGEIFTEAAQLEGLNGTVVVFGFPTVDHLTAFTEPFTVTIEKGFLISHTGPAEFEAMLALIREEEGVSSIQVREIGFGLNRGMGFEHRLNEPTAFERFCGMHFSLGMKHNMYRKKFKKDVVQKYHVDIFCLVETVFIGGTKVFEKGTYIV